MDPSRPPTSTSAQRACPFQQYKSTSTGMTVCVTGLAAPATPQWRNHQEIHYRVGDQTRQKPFLHEAAHQSLRIQLADHQLSNPKDHHLDGKGSQGKTPFHCTETQQTIKPVNQSTIGRLLPHGNRHDPEHRMGSVRAACKLSALACRLQQLFP